MAVSRREQKAGILEQAKAAIAKLRDERAAALRVDDGARIKKVTTALGEAREALELAEQAHEIAAEDERVAAAELARLTAAAEERRRSELIAELLKESLAHVKLQNDAADVIAESHRELARLTEELKKLKADEALKEIEVARLDMRGVPGILGRRRS
ncbi:MAG TPA: hypothetical protein VGS98_02125 [Thermoanaerobaculia bacterium]|nr:hypothetical protein [Thermoanaerobaculia bacterium]